MRTIALTTALALVAGSLTGCSSSYMPQSRGKVAVVMRSGAPAYVRDGKTHEHGLLGGGLSEAVEGNPGAMQAANEYQDRMKFGLLGILGGMVCSVGGLVYAGVNAERDPENGQSDLNGKAKVGLIISLGCLVVMIAGAGYLASAEPYRWDAINIYNDTTPVPLPLPGAPPPGWSAQVMKKSSLKMRE